MISAVSTALAVVAGTDDDDAYTIRVICPRRPAPLRAGILLGSNRDIPAFRWVEKERGVVMACSSPEGRIEIERRHAGNGLLANGGASRGNLLAGEAEHMILTLSRLEEEKRANPGYRAFYSMLTTSPARWCSFGLEVILEWVAALRAIRRDVRPRGRRGGVYPFVRAAACFTQAKPWMRSGYPEIGRPLIANGR